MYIAPKHYENGIDLDSIKPGMRLEIHMRKGKHAGREFYFDVVKVDENKIYDSIFILNKSDLIKALTEYRDRDQTDYPMIAGEGAPQYTFALPTEPIQLALL